MTMTRCFNSASIQKLTSDQDSRAIPTKSNRIVGATSTAIEP